MELSKRSSTRRSGKQPQRAIGSPAAAGGCVASYEQMIAEELREAAEFEKARQQRLKAIKKEPGKFFRMGPPHGFDEDDVRAAYAVLRGKWDEAVGMTIEAERQRLIDQGYSAKQVALLVRIGWAWKHQDCLIAVQEVSPLVKAAPRGDLRKMVLVHTGWRWEPAATLAALARIDLRVPNPTAIGNATGSFLAARTATVRQIRAFADFVAHQNVEQHLKPIAGSLCDACDTLLALMVQKNPDSVVGAVSAAMNVAYLDDALLIEIESEMMDANRRQFVFYHNRKPDPTGSREAVRRAVLKVFERTRAMPRRQEVMDELKADVLPDGRIRFDQDDLTPRQFDKLLEGIRKDERSKWQTTPDVKRGRPRKEKF